MENGCGKPVFPRDCCIDFDSGRLDTVNVLSLFEINCFDFSVFTTLECSEKLALVFVSFPEYGTWSESLRLDLVSIVVFPQGNGDKSGFGFEIGGFVSRVNEVECLLSCDFEVMTGEGVSGPSVMSDNDFDGTI